MTNIDKLDSLERRVAALEEMLTHQALALDEVSEQLHLAEQAREMLAGKQKALLQRVQAVEDVSRDGGDTLQDARPPHY